ncbi:MAG: T9SS type A sorting domain-containing protein [Bacteroidota bacterium]
MTRKLLPIILLVCLFLIRGNGLSQTVAMDFNQADCSGTNHNLFSDLDNGKVAVIDFVEMNCSSCVVATNGIKTLLPPFDVSNPGRVELFSFGYDDTYSCQTMTTWKNTYGYTHPVFSGGGAQTNYYGGMGMPTIVVVGGPEHTVLYKSLGYSSTDKPAITAAITAGLALWSGINEIMAENGIHVYPTLFGNQVNVHFDKAFSADLQIYDMLGKLVMSESKVNTDKYTFNTSGLQKGVYALKIMKQGTAVGTLRIVKQ